MRGLTTLKDLVKHNDDELSFGGYIVDILREEAVKWVKEFQKERTGAISEMFDNVDKHGIYPTTKFFNRIDNFWLDKFNLTTGDLK